MPEPISSTPCSRCRRPLPVGHAEGNCPACLLESALLDDDPATADVLAEEVPAELGDFEILGIIGRGGSSVVYRARQRRVNRIVALKTLHGISLSRRESFERLRIEAEAVGRLEHPHIVPLYEVGRHHGTPFLALRLFERGSLAEALKARRFTLREAAQLVATAARAVHHAHQRGVLHRDLKPSNLLLDEHGAPHVADFGLAKLADSDSSLTLSTSVLGTPAYMAPEQAGGRIRQVGVPADIHALGAILFELLAGRPPFLGASALEILRQVADAEPPKLRELNPAVDRDLEAICLKCLEKDPSLRYGDANALADDLDRWLRHDPISLRPLKPRERLLRWVRRRPLVAALSASLGLALVTGVIATGWQSRRAVVATRQAREAERVARRQAYVADMNLAAQASEENPGLALELLERHRPRPGQPDLRGWEWRHLWQTVQPDSITVLGQRTNSIFSAAATADGQWLGVGEFNGGFFLWDLVARRCVWTNSEPVWHQGFHAGTRVVASPTEGWLAFSISTATNRHEVRVLDPATKTVRWTGSAPGQIRMLAVSGDGRRLVASTLGPQPEVIAWESQTGRVQSRFPAPVLGALGHNRGNPLAVSDDGRWVAIDDYPGHVQVLDLDSGRQRWRFKTAEAQVCALAFSPDGKMLAVGTAYQEWVIRFWDLATGTSVGRLEGHRGWISSLRFSADGQTLISASQDQTVRLWDVPARAAREVLRGHRKEIWCLAALSDGDRLVTGSKDGELRLWSVGGTRPRPTQFLAPPVNHWRFGFSADGQSLWAAATNGIIFRAHGPGFRSLEWKPEWGTNNVSVAETSDGSRLMVGQDDGVLVLRRLSDGREERRMAVSRAPVLALTVPRDARPFCFSDGRYLRWNPEATVIDGTWLEDPLNMCGAPMPDGSGFISVRHDGTFWRQWFRQPSPETGQLSQREIMGVAFSPNGALLATASDYGEVRLWTAADHRPVAALGGFLGAVRGVAFSPDGTRVATGAGGADSFCLWDLESHQRLIRLRTDSMLIRPLVYSPDGHTIAGQDLLTGRLRLWTAPAWSEIERAE